MHGVRSELTHWVESGCLQTRDLPQALRVAAITPGPGEWRAFLSVLLLTLGLLFTALGVVFFVAFNWGELGRIAKFSLVQAAIAVGVAACWFLGLDRLAGKAALLACTLLLGALLALVGQTYQTGANSYALFAGWALLTLPWAIVSCFPAQWLLWLGIANTALALYSGESAGLWGMRGTPEPVLWSLFALNTAALVVWEAGAAAGVPWLRERWAVRVVASASGGTITTLTIWAIAAGSMESWPVLVLVGYVAWLAGACLVYRSVVRDLFVLAGGVLSVVVTCAASLGRLLLHTSSSYDTAGRLFLIGLVVIALSAGGGWWLKSISREGDA